MATKDVDIQAAEQIQTKVAEWAHAGYEIYEDGLATPYTESFYDHCITYWLEAGYDEEGVRETVDAAVKELEATFA